MTYILLANAFFQPLLNFFNPFHLLRKYRQRRARVRADAYLTQLEANTLFEGPPLDLAQRYANVTKMFLVALIYAPLLPIGLLIAMCGIAFDYMISKYLLLRRHSRPNRLSSDLSNTITRLVPFGIFLYALSLFFFMNMLESDGAGVAFVWMLVCLTHLFLPISLVRRLCRKTSVDIFEQLYRNTDYYKDAVDFIDDYDRANPVTSD
jgi:hypothetical protein